MNDDYFRSAGSILLPESTVCLAETQRIGRVPAWFAWCTAQVKEYGAYWAALGTILVDHGEYEAAARALLEAIYLNPTDRICYQRMGRVLDALDKPEDAAQFRYHGINIADSERGVEQLLNNINSIALKKAMDRELLELFRPFETLQWTASMLPSTAVREAMVINQQRAQLLRNPDALKIISESSMFGLDRNRFSLGQSIAIRT